MSDLAEIVLQHVGQNEVVDSLQLSSELQQDHQKIVGAIKSIQVNLECWGEPYCQTRSKANAETKKK